MLASSWDKKFTILQYLCVPLSLDLELHVKGWISLFIDFLFGRFNLTAAFHLIPELFCRLHFHISTPMIIYSKSQNSLFLAIRITWLKTFRIREIYARTQQATFLKFCSKFRKWSEPQNHTSVAWNYTQQFTLRDTLPLLDTYLCIRNTVSPRLASFRCSSV